MTRLAPIAVVAALAASGALASSGCYGSWSAARAVHRWNGHITQDRYVNSVIHFGLFVIPVYPIVALGDFFIFNTVEFFTGQPVFE
jgi:hypothetical protein